MKTTIGFVSLFLASLLVSGHHIKCDDSDEVLADVCYKLYQQIEDALSEDKGNLYRLRKSFFYAPNASPVILRVIYNVTYSENVTNYAKSLPYCTNATNIISINKTRLVYGWTSSGVYTVFHPLTLNFMQIQLPFVLLKSFFHMFKYVDPVESGPEAETFLWDGSYELPTLYINLHLTSLPCLPSTDIFKSVLKDFNSLVSSTYCY